MKLLFLLSILTLFCNPGIVIDYNNNRKYLLQCDEPECNYELDLNNTGYYTYITEDKQDTVVFLVTEDLGTVLLRRTENKPFLFQIIE